MIIKEIQNKEIWENFLLEFKEKTFLSSWNWGEFQEKQGNKIWRLGIYDNQLVAVVLVVKMTAKRGTFLFAPHGPVVENPKPQCPMTNQTPNPNASAFAPLISGATADKQIIKTLLEELKKIGKQEKVSFIRINPIWEKTDKNIKIFKDLGFKQAPIHVHYEITWELDIRPDEEELLTGMRKTTRYLIKQAEKNPDIKIIKSDNINDLKIFNDIYQQTVKKQKFVPFSLKYLENEFDCFSKNNGILIFFGKYKEKIVASAIIVFWQNTAFYHHGASISEYNNNKIPVSYILQWEVIKEAKKRGCVKYDFWGVEAKNKNSTWAGFSQFKMGFGGSLRECVKTQDFVLSPRYYLTYIIEKIRKVRRGI